MADKQSQYKALLAKYLRDECTDDERERLHRWYESLDGKIPVPSETQLTVLAQKNWSVVANRMDHNALRPKLGARRWGWRQTAAVVAGLLLLAGSGWYIRQQATHFSAATGLKTHRQPDWVTQANATTKPIRVVLADGSVVSLQPGGELKYPTRFNRIDRSVRLTGQAFFDVQRDPAHPFRVQTSLFEVKVLGTSFTVSAFRARPTAEVAVRTGQVEVVRSQDKAKVVLLPNERVTVSRKTNPLVKSLVQTPLIVSPQAVTRSFDFANEPVADVFATLEQAYHIPIRFDATALAQCTLTARLTDQPLFTKLDMICASIGATYTVQGTQVVVSGAGCNVE